MDDVVHLRRAGLSSRRLDELIMLGYYISEKRGHFGVEKAIQRKTIHVIMLRGRAFIKGAI